MATRLPRSSGHDAVMVDVFNTQWGPIQLGDVILPGREHTVTERTDQITALEALGAIAVADVSVPAEPAKKEQP
jgi:hypothetical protein